MAWFCHLCKQFETSGEKRRSDRKNVNGVSPLNIADDEQQVTSVRVKEGAKTTVKKNPSK